MKIDKYEFPDDLYYDDEHNWARVEDNVVTQGMSDFGQDLAGELVYAEIPRIGRKVERGKPFMSMESGKWVGRVKAIVSGEIVEVNEEVEWESTLINSSPYDEGWLVKIKADDLSELDNLFRPNTDEFKDFIAAEREKYGK